MKTSAYTGNLHIVKHVHKPVQDNVTVEHWVAKSTKLVSDSFFNYQRQHKHLLTQHHYQTWLITVSYPKGSRVCITYIRPSGCVITKLLLLYNHTISKIWNNDRNIVTTMNTALMCPQGQLYLNGNEFQFTGQSLPLCCWTSFAFSAASGFLSARSKTWLLLLASSSTNTKVFIGESGKPWIPLPHKQDYTVCSLQTNTE